MDTRAENSKLAELCAKTDQQLQTLICSRLDRGLTFARLLLDEEARQRWSSMDEFFSKAEKAYQEVASLLPVLRGISKSERRRLERRLIQLRDILDCAALCAVPRVQAAAML